MTVFFIFIFIPERSPVPFVYLCFPSCSSSWLRTRFIFNIRMRLPSSFDLPFFALSQMVRGRDIIRSRARKTYLIRNCGSYFPITNPSRLQLLKLTHLSYISFYSRSSFQATDIHSWMMLLLPLFTYRTTRNYYFSRN